MEFGRVPVGAAAGAVLAHSVALPKGRLKKGSVLGAEDVARMVAAGVDEVTVARLGPDDMGEDAAALALARALVGEGEGLRLSKPHTGRVNIFAQDVGLARLDEARLHAANAIDPMLTLATVPPWRRMAAGDMVATVKVIAYGVPGASVAAVAEAGAGAITLSPITARDATLIVTDHDAGSSEETGKGLSAIHARMSALGITLLSETRVGHDPDALAEAIISAQGALVLILTASATSDPADVGPEALRRAGGRVTRFGMPVDPGNLLFYGTDAQDRWVIGLPGCARSPALNGADWVLERLASGHPPTAQDIARMGVGGLLKESPRRKQPRAGVLSQD